MSDTKESLFLKIFGKSVKQPYPNSLDDLADLQVQENAVHKIQTEMEIKKAQYEAMRNQSMWQMQNAYTMQRDPNTVPLPPMKMEDLDSPAGKATLEELADFWRARWGDKWVERKEISDEFYTVTAQRLLATGRLEVHELASGTRVYRPVER